MASMNNVVEIFFLVVLPLLILAVITGFVLAGIVWVFT
jgi:ABC-type spermidine/putrescine transport system permease subunit II